MRARLPAVLLVSLASACAASSTRTMPPASPPAPPASAPSAASPASARFAALTSRFLAEHLRRNPTDATKLGEHAYDATWPDVSAEGDEAELRFLDATAADLAAFDREPLSDEERTDASILANRLALSRLWTAEIRDADRSPIFYTRLVGDGLDPLVTRDFAPLAERMKSLRGRLLGVPAILAVAKKRLAHPARIATETAIEQTKGLLGLCERRLPPLFAQVPSMRADLEAARDAAAASLRDFQRYLEGDLLPRSDGSFRIGRPLFTKLLQLSLDDAIDPDALVRDARASMAETRAEMLATSLDLWPTLFREPPPKPASEPEKRAVVKRVLDALAEDRPDDATIVRDATRVLGDATAFVRAHDLVTVPDEPCDVIEMPEYRRGVATAYCDASGPLEAKPQTFLAIAPPPADWPAEQRASHYREYNESMLADLIVHEGMPGHYLQIMRSNRFRSDVRSAFRNLPFVEGWAAYTEWLMAKHGFGGPKVKMQQLKMLLRVAANTVLDHGVHAGSMEEPEALALLRDEAFQEEGEARGKWKRARLSKGQLTNYYYGVRELLKLRARAERRPGFQERAYNDLLVSFGSPPLRVIRDRVARAGY